MICSFSQVKYKIVPRLIVVIHVMIVGESMDPKGMIIMVEYKEVNGEEKPVIMFFKHGLEEEKC